jgi:hypothetical protein
MLGTSKFWPSNSLLAWAFYIFLTNNLCKLGHQPIGKLLEYFLESVN